MGKEIIDLPQPRKANACLNAFKKARRRQFLFDEFWREGEMCLMFGESGSYKSVLALRIAEALARGTPFDGFRMPRGRRRVLYVDMVLDDAQFGERCSAEKGRGRRTHKFSDNLHRDAPPSAELLIDWLRSAVKTDGIQVVILDDLSAIKKTHDGVRESLTLMRRLRKLRDELGISILLLSDAANPGRREDVSEADMGRARVLCGMADGAFGMGKFRHSREKDQFYLVQTRARSRPIFWTTENSPFCRIFRGDSGLLSVRFDARFAEAMDSTQRRRINEVHRLRERGELSFRSIAERLGISKSTAARLYNKWIPAMDEYEDRDDTTARHATETDAEREEAAARYDFLNDLDNEDDIDCEEDGRENAATEAIEADTGEPEPPPRRSVYDLRHAFAPGGRDMYIEQFEHHTGRPAVWYKFDSDGNKQRYRRDPSGIMVEHLDAGPFL